ncbi:NADH dehydrogenase [ubiquinone] iron-sulfur protein 5-like [Pectinophora gossypiella]|uniref:NADH dehydrogenase [ubiquinone] iron-sulfur protein 5-like n=1 Tax=Pectinophora gossypiella TaxID=13191 RepID=UPI00214E0B2A|nr:NADH dehydrogenase [ubiquinone] iron-sulfur protein 5-like [Pectinophora gossypiella]
MQNLSPFIRSPFTDLTGGLVSHQMYGTQCGPLELQMMECIEFYGLDRGVKKCRCLIEDFKECHTMTKQFGRFIAMRAERDRQIRCGKLKGKDKYMNARLDSY